MTGDINGKTPPPVPTFPYSVAANVAGSDYLKPKKTTATTGTQVSDGVQRARIDDYTEL